MGVEVKVLGVLHLEPHIEVLLIAVEERLIEPLAHLVQLLLACVLMERRV